MANHQFIDSQVPPKIESGGGGWVADLPDPLSDLYPTGEVRSYAPPIREFDKEDIIRFDTGQTVDRPTELERSVRLEIRPALGPHEIERRSGPVFPAQDRVATDRPGIEIRIREHIRGRRSCAVAVDRIPNIPQCVHIGDRG